MSLSAAFKLQEALPSTYRLEEILHIEESHVLDFDRDVDPEGYASACVKVGLAIQFKALRGVLVEEIDLGVGYDFYRKSGGYFDKATRAIAPKDHPLIWWTARIFNGQSAQLRDERDLAIDIYESTLAEGVPSAGYRKLVATAYSSLGKLYLLEAEGREEPRASLHYARAEMWLRSACIEEEVTLDRRALDRIRLGVAIRAGVPTRVGKCRIEESNYHLIRGLEEAWEADAMSTAQIISKELIGCMAGWIGDPSIAVGLDVVLDKLRELGVRLTEKKAREDQIKKGRAVDGGVKPSEDFAAAVSALKSRLVREPSDDEIDEIESLLLLAKNGISKDQRVSAIVGLRVILEATRIDLVDRESRKPITLTIKNGSVYLDGGGKKSVRLADASFDLQRRDPPQFKPRASRAKKVRNHGPEAPG